MRTKWFANSSRWARGKLIFHKLEANTGHPAPQFPLFSHKNWTNFGSWQMVWEMFTDGAAQVRSSLHTYVHLVRMCVPGLTWHGNSQKKSKIDF